MSKWLLSIIGVVFVGVIFDIIYPNGKTNAVCRSVFGIMAIFVIIKPVFNFVKVDHIDESYIDKNLLINIDESKCDYLESKIKSDLLEKDPCEIYKQVGKRVPCQELSGVVLYSKKK